MKLGEELVKLAVQRYFMEVIDSITYEDLKRLATKVNQLEAETECLREYYEASQEQLEAVAQLRKAEKAIGGE